MPPDDSCTPPAPAPLPWTARLLVFAAFVVFLHQFWVGLAASVLLQSGFLGWFYGPDFAALVGGAGETAGRELAVTRVNLWAISLAFPLWAASAAVACRLILSPVPGELSPEQTSKVLGLPDLSLSHFGRKLLTGLLAWAVLTPLALGVNWLVLFLYQCGGVEGVTTEHPFTRVAQSDLLPAEWVPFVLAATVAAAVYEEVLFRGILQPLCAGHKWGGAAAMAGALVMMLCLRWDPLVSAYHRGDGSLKIELIPIGFVLATVPGFLAVWRFGRAPRAAGVYGTALLFAAIHATVWPSPIGLFVFALGVGYLAERTGSLVGPIVVHTLFNGVTCAWLLLQWLLAAR
jgi:membrane protease YdiL (CAAX protease family)